MADEATTLVVEPQKVNLQVGQTQVLNITTNAADGFTFTIDKADVLEFNKDSKTITALAEGSATLTISAKNGTAASVQATVAITVTQLTTTLIVRPEITKLNIGEKQIIKVETDADDYTVETSDKSVVEVDKATKTIYGLSAGNAKVTFKATRQYYKEKIVEFNIAVAEEPGIPVKIKLHNKDTGRYTTIQTSNNESTEDVIFRLPEASGTLITEEGLENKIKVVDTPRITSPLNNATNYEGMIESTFFQTILGFKGDHTASEWEFALDANFTNIIGTKKAIGARGHNLTQVSPKFAKCTLFVRVRYYSGEHVSDWSDVVTFSSGLAGPAGPQEVKTGNCATAAYFGEVPFSDCIADRWYFGNWATLKEIAKNYAYTTATNGRGDYLVNAPVGSQVHYKDKLYYAKEYLRTSDNKFQIEPGTDDTKWVEDNRDNLHTPKKFVYECGIGYNARPNKLNGNLKMVDATYWHRDPYPGTDKPTTLPNYIYPWPMKGDTPTTLPTLYDIPECSWLKFGYKGKILYTPKLPLLCTIAWNDLAKLRWVYGDRTMRIGSRLYYVRLLTEDEYKKLLIGLTDGTLGTMSDVDLHLNQDTLPEDINIFRNSLKVWLEDFREGTVRKTITGGKDNVKVEDISPRSATGVWRPVLELIPEGEEPYNNLPESITCYDENFQYDKYTDTGFFGRIKSLDIIDGTTLANLVGFTVGTNQLANYDWLKFYSHGRIIYTPMSTFKHSVHWANMNDANIHYGVDLGGRGKKTVDIGNFKMVVETLTNSHSMPRWNDNSWQDHSIMSNGYEEYNTRGRVNHNSDFQELLVRVTGIRIKSRPFMYSTDELSESGVWCETTYDHEFSDYQIGDNWAEFPMVDMCVRYCDGFSGTAIYGKNLVSYVGADKSAAAWVDDLANADNAPRVWYRGVGKWFGAGVPPHVSTYYGWRPVLATPFTK